MKEIIQDKPNVISKLFNRFWCALWYQHTHALRKFDHIEKRVYVKCDCGFESPGITLQDTISKKSEASS